MDSRRGWEDFCEDEDADDEETDRKRSFCSSDSGSLEVAEDSVEVATEAGLGSVRVHGDLTVENSTNVQVGNNTHYHGPVTVVLPDPSLHDGIGDLVLSAAALVEAARTTPAVTKDEAKDPVDVTSDGSIDKTALVWGSFLRWPCVVVPVAVLATVIVTIFTVVLTRSHSAVDENASLPNGTDEGTDGLVLVTRAEWGALPSRKVEVLTTPVRTVIIEHTGTSSCFEKTECSTMVAALQRMNMDGDGAADIGFNFLVGGDGRVYEGRGWDVVGAHCAGWNAESIGVAAIGTFSLSPPTAAQRTAMMALLQRGVDLDKIHAEYRLYGKCQLNPTADSPGLRFMDDLQTWPHFHIAEAVLSSCVL